MRLPAVKGIKQVQKAFERKRAGMARRFSTNLKAAGVFIERESQILCPVDTGNLRNSAFTDSKGSGFKTIVVVGYTASYGVFVHENLASYHRPPTQAKFLEQVVRDRRQEIIAIAGRGLV